MLDFVTGLQVLLIVLVAMTIFAGVWIIGVCFDSWGDFIKSLTDKEYNYLSFVFRKGKHIRFITDFPNDLRRECLGKESYYADKEDDSAGVRKAKMLVRRVLGNDTIVNEYFKGQYFTYKDFLEVKELCDLPEYDETSELLDELGAHLKEPKTAVTIMELIIGVMTDDLVEFKAGKREAALLKALNKSECTKVPWEQKDFVAFMIKLGINSGEFKGVKESTVGTYSTEIQKNMDIELCEYSVHLQKLIDKRILQFLEKK